MTFVTSEPYIGHMGLGGVGDSKGLMESELRQRHIQWITNAKVTGVCVAIPPIGCISRRSRSRHVPPARTLE